MYVCHCNRIPEREIRTAIDALTTRGVGATVTAGDVLQEMNRFGKCLGCFPLIEAMLAGEDNPTTLAPVPEHPEQATTPLTPKRQRRGGAFARRNTP